MWNFSERRGIAEKCRKSLQFIFHFHTMEISRRAYGDCGVSTEIPWSAIAFLRSSSWRSTARSRRAHGVSTACTPRVRSGHRACTASARRAHGVHTVHAISHQHSHHAMFASYCWCHVTQSPALISCCPVRELNRLRSWITISGTPAVSLPQCCLDWNPYYCPHHTWKKLNGLHTGAHT